LQRKWNDILAFSPDASFLSYNYDNAKRVTLIADNSGNKIEIGYNLNGDMTSRAIKTAANAVVFQ
jgi:YD repeat-containing protein